MTALIRLASPRDAENLHEIYAPLVRDTAVSFELEPPTVAEMRRRVEETLARFPWLVCEDNGEVLGYAYAGAHRARPAYQWSVDVSVYVHPGVRRSGIGAAVYTSLFALLALQGFYHAFAGITLPNPASVGLHESLGFRSVGVYRSVGFKLARWHDVGWWQLSLREPGGQPPSPKDFQRVRGGPGWEESMARGLRFLR